MIVAPHSYYIHTSFLRMKRADVLCAPAAATETTRTNNNLESRAVSKKETAEEVERIKWMK